MRKVFLDDLPRWESGTNKGKIKWDECVGIKVKIVYDNVEYEIEIIKYEKKGQKLYLKYDNEQCSITSGGFTEGKIGKLLVRYESYKTDNFEIYNKLKMNGIGVVWGDIKIGEILKTNHKKYGYNEFKFLGYNSSKSTLYLEINGMKCDPIMTNGFTKGRIGGLITKYESYKSDNFEIYNKLKMNGYGVIWNNIEVGEILKTNHKVYGYREFEFIKYELKGQNLYLKYDGIKCKPIFTGNFMVGQIGSLIGEITKEFKIDIGEHINDKKRDLIIIDREYKKDKDDKQWKWYKYKCNKCGFFGWITEGSLSSQKTGCACCCGNIVVEGINDLYTTDYWMVDFGISIEDAKKHTKSSGNKITVKCPYCSKEKQVTISNIYNDKSIGCVCGSGYSYNEKFMAEVLNQLNIDYTCQLSKSTFEWCGEYRYDFYIPSLNAIIETHGRQHYEASNRGRSLKEERNNDDNKRQLAKNNGVDEYIVIDCRYSDMEYVKDNILKSKLSELFSFCNIDWLRCEGFAISKKSLIKEVYSYWNNKKDFESVVHLSKVFNISKYTAIKYLKHGTNLKLCNYNPKDEMKKSALRAIKMKQRPVMMFGDGVLLGVFESGTELERKSEKLFGVKLLQSQISNVCLGKKKQYKNYTFKYID